MTTPEMDTDRLEAFSDGVFAIAITLLVLDFRVPDLGRDLGRALLDLWPSLFAYVISFATIGVIWVSHHGIFDRIDRIDRTFLFLNLFLLATIALIPFPTAVLARFLNEIGKGELAASFYSASLLLMAIAFALVTRHATRVGALATPMYPTGRRQRATNLGLIVYPIAMLLSMISPYLALAACISVAIFYALPPRRPGR
jgi:TMEM175 potassium channel family protein